MRVFRLAPILVLLLLLPAVSASAGPYTVAAYYYSWYGGTVNPHWPEGVAHTPWIGYYYSGNPNVARQQIDLATKYGVDVFAVSWTGVGSPSENKFKAGLLKAPNLSQIRFCIFYETVIRLAEGKSPTVADFNQPSVRQLFMNDMMYIAQTYFHNPSYWKINGRPVVSIYVARVFQGDYASMFQELRARMRAIGWNPYFVGDDVFWGRNDLFNASQFDAVTIYNIYWSGLFQQRVNTTLQLAQTVRPFFFDLLYQLSNLQVMGKSAKVVFQPGVIPQFDNRKSAHTSTALLAQNQDQVRTMFLVAKDILDEETTTPKVVWITSWNEWHEGTAIEPTVSGGTKYPGGNFGYDFLQLVSEIFQ